MEQKRLLLKRDGLGDIARLGLRPSEDSEWLTLWAFVSSDYWEIFEVTQQDNVLWAWQVTGDKNRLRPGKQWSDIVRYVALPRAVSDAAGTEGIPMPDGTTPDDEPEDVLSALHRLGWKSARWHTDQEHVWVAPYYLSRAQAVKLIVECLTYHRSAATISPEKIREYAAFGPFPDDGGRP